LCMRLLADTEGEQDGGDEMSDLHDVSSRVE
jgi:hypothetical protein